MTHSDDALVSCVRCNGAGAREEFSASSCPISPNGAHSLSSGLHVVVKQKLDALHKNKIELADEVLVLNVRACKFCKCVEATTGTGFACAGRVELRRLDTSGPIPPMYQHVFEPYVGESTKSEIRHALSLGKPVRFLNDQVIDHVLWERIKPAGVEGEEPIGNLRAGELWALFQHRGGK